MTLTAAVVILEISSASADTHGIRHPRSNLCTSCRILVKSLTSGKMLLQGGQLIDRSLASVSREITVWPFKTFPFDLIIKY